MLAWIKGELDETIRQARVALEDYVEGSGAGASMERCAELLHQIYGTLRMVRLYGVAMLAAITTNYFRLHDVGERRRLRVLIAGGALGTLPALSRFFVMGLAPRSALHAYLMSPGPDVLIAVAFLLFPASFAYAVLRHRLLDIRDIVRQGVRYALARGVVISVVPALGFLLLVDVLAHGDQPLLGILRARGFACIDGSLS